ncbi:MAG: FAD-dependent oxidoreductase [Nanoarchaeota archaeon]
MKYDLIIIGAGPAGLTAGIYATRSGMKTAIISKDIGGTANTILKLENWPGYSGTGTELMKKFYEQLKKYDVEIITEEVVNIEKKGKDFFIKTSKKELNSASLILATGSIRRNLKIPGEERLKGKGVSYCATCDSFFFKNRVVAVIGGSDCAVGSAIALANIAKKVYILYRGEKLRCENINLEKVKSDDKIEAVYNVVPKEIKGKDKVESLVFEKKGKSEEIKLDGIFIEIGSSPLTEFTKELKLKLDENNYIIVDEEMNSSVAGIFAAGDVTNSKLKQVLTASAQGAVAAKNVLNWLKK